MNIKIEEADLVVNESKGDYWLTQHICQTICLMSDVMETQETLRHIRVDLNVLRQRVTSKLEHSYAQPVIDFCRGRRFRPTNDPYLKLLKTVSEQDSSIVDLTELANANPSVRGSINNIKEKRLTILLDSKTPFQQYFTS